MVLKNVAIALIIAVAFTVPAATAQLPSPVAKCTKECTPEEVNGGAIKKGDEITNMVLYSHWEDILNMAPLNTQVPDATQEKDLNRGFLMPVLDTNFAGCPVGGICPDFHFKNNEFTMYSSPGLVEYLSDGSWRTHQEPGLAADVEIAAQDLTLYWYMSSHAIPTQTSSGGPGQIAKVGVMPQVGVYAHLETGRFKWKGAMIAQSDDFDATASQPGGANRVNLVTGPHSGDDTYEFVVKMHVKDPVIPSAELAAGFIVYINPYQVKTQGGANAGAQFAQEEWRIRTGPLWLPRVIMPVSHVMQTKASSLTIFEDRLFVRWSFVSAFGSYDLNDQSLVLDVTGPNPIEKKAVEFIILKRSVDHDGHFKPVNATWAVDYVNFPLADGKYQLTASIKNLQKTYQLEQKFDFDVVGGKPQVQQIGAPRGGSGGGAAASAAPAGGNSGIPGFEAVLMVTALAVALGVFIRRRHA